jgi:hypothetical protein
MRSLARLMPKITKASLGKKGLLFGRLLKQWPTILGPEKARFAIPKKLSFHQKNDKSVRQATLYLSTTAAYATLLNHEKPLWLGKINTFFGYEAVKDLKFVHDLKPHHQTSKKQTSIQLDSKTEKMVQDLVATVQNNDLREVLMNYGCSLQQSLEKKKLNQSK